MTQHLSNAQGGSPGIGMSASLPWTVTEVDRDNPSAEFIERMRSEFPTKREADLILTRKMQRRASPSFTGASFEA
ncbi:hypothetical protein J7E70_15600 [Variovorax paradoxus]|nr:hypothetical protein [Variovorax paradoxus]MBT2301886.1 hypothetical protein [Variovorax paradoxus]